MEVVVDASNVPGEYALTILSECAAFPRRLVFFLKGQLEVRSWKCLLSWTTTDSILTDIAASSDVSKSMPIVLLSVVASLVHSAEVRNVSL